STSLALTSGSGAIGSLDIATPNLTFNTTGNVTLVDSTAITANSASTGNNISLTDSANGGISLTNSITANGTLGLINTGTNSHIALGASVGGTATTITATGTGAITQSAGTITGSTSLALTSGSGGIGSLNIATPNLTFNTTGDVTLTDSTAITGSG